MTEVRAIGSSWSPNKLHVWPCDGLLAARASVHLLDFVESWSFSCSKRSNRFSSACADGVGWGRHVSQAQRSDLGRFPVERRPGNLRTESGRGDGGSDSGDGIRNDSQVLFPHVSHHSAFLCHSSPKSGASWPWPPPPSPWRSPTSAWHWGRVGAATSWSATRWRSSWSRRWSWSKACSSVCSAASTRPSSSWGEFCWGSSTTPTRLLPPTDSLRSAAQHPAGDPTPADRWPPEQDGSSGHRHILPVPHNKVTEHLPEDEPDPDTVRVNQKGHASPETVLDP